MSPRATWLAVGLPLLLALAIGRHGAPTEDAYIFLRYARHLAEGRGMVYNADGPPVEGATSLPFAFGTALFLRAGVDPLLAGRWVGILALAVAAVAAARWAVARGLELAPTLALSLGLSFTGATALAGLGYDTPLAFAAAFVLALDLGTRFLFRPDAPLSRPASLRIAIAGAFLAVNRVDGMALAFAVWGVLFLDRADRRTLAVPLGVALTGVAAWHGARWTYFGHPMPNAFYVKVADGRGYPGLFALATGKFLLLTAPWWLASVASRERSGRFLFPPLAFLAIWAAANNEMNLFSRFQLPALPFFVVGAVHALSRAASFRPIFAAGLAAATGWQVFRLASPPEAIEPMLVAVGRRLAPERDVRLAVSEAGALPYWSDLPTLDTHGLNDERIAHRGLDEAYLDEWRPDLVVFHDSPGSGIPGWAAMGATLDRWARMRGFTEAPPRSSDRGAYRFWITPDPGKRARIRRALSEARGEVDGS